MERPFTCDSSVHTSEAKCGFHEQGLGTISGGLSVGGRSSRSEPELGMRSDIAGQPSGLNSPDVDWRLKRRHPKSSLALIPTTHMLPICSRDVILDFLVNRVDLTGPTLIEPNTSRGPHANVRPAKAQRTWQKSLAANVRVLCRMPTTSWQMSRSRSSEHPDSMVGWKSGEITSGIPGENLPGSYCNTVVENSDCFSIP